MLIVINYINDNSSATKTISYNGNNLRISIDGEVSSILPTSGNYYLVDYDCKSSNTKVEWIKYTDDNNEVQYKLNVSNGTKKSGVICNLEFKSNPLLSEMPVGSYVAYTGDNNCDNTNVNGWTSCMGKNANYVSDTDMGYCSSSSGYKFHVNGWRLAYVEDGSPHLISAGATDCMCTSSDGKSSSSSCSSSLTSTNLYMHFNNMNNIALKYCNKNYAKGGICTSITTYDEKNNPVDKDNATAWAMLADIKTEDDPRETSDFKKITGSDLSSSSCYGSNVSNRFACGYTNDLIDNGGYYWIATPYSTSYNYAFNWNPNYRGVDYYSSYVLHGVRPVLALESSIRVMGGDGTYSNPYIINNDYFEINNGAKYISTNDNISQVQLSLNSSSETTKMCISVNTSVCTNYISYSDIYTLDWSSEADGEKVVYVYFKDSNDEIVASMNRSIIIDTTVPTNNSVSITSESGVYATVAFASTGADYMCLSDTSNSASDCTKWIDYTTSYNWIFSEGTGTKNLYAFFKDKAGNISSVVSDSMTCSSNCYKYFMDSYNNSYIYLMRSDGATALATTSTTNFTWYSEGSQSMNVCGAYNYSSNGNGRIWCIGNDNNAYYKTRYSATSWSKVNISSYIDTTNYTYSIYPYGTTGAYIVRDDGKNNLINTSTSGLASTSWSYGYETSMATCSGYSSSQVICLGVDGNYYYKTDYSNTSAYIKRSFVKLTNRTNTNSWIDMYYNSNTNIIESDGNNLYNTRFSYSTSTTPTWYPTTIPGNGIKTCTSSGYSTYNYCLGYDGYLYYKTYSATSWAKSSLNVNQ